MRFTRNLQKLTGKSRYVVAAFVMMLSLVSPLASTFQADTVNAATMTLAGKTIKQVETGFDSACAVADNWAYCWGANDEGQVGKGSFGGNVTTATAVSSSTTGTPAGPAVCIAYWWIFCTAYGPGTPAVPPSAMAGLEVEKVSVGFTHACAIANARVYCWGANNLGQLGNRTNTASAVPVKVDVQSTDAPGKPKSALSQKEIVDIAAGEFFTCALASDGTVACWGSGQFGRLGIASEDSTNYPKAVYMGGDLAGKKGIKLARAASSTMCVLAVSDANFTTSADKGNPYCWGLGIGDGDIPGPGRATVPCNSRDALATRPSGTGSITTFFSSDVPLRISDTQLFSQVDGSDYVTGLSDNGRAYYWGMHGYRVNNTYISTTSCSVNPCTVVANKIRLAVSVGNAAGAKAKQKARNNAKNSNKPGGDKNKNLNSNQTAQQAAQNAARGGVATSISGSGGNLVVRGSLNSDDSYSVAVAQHVSGNNVNVTSYRGQARPGGSATGASQVGGNNNNNNNNNNRPGACAPVTRYGYTTDRTVDEIGKMVPTVPHTSTLNQSTLSLFSGDVEEGLFCAVKTTGGTFCDANGTGMDEGQTGSNYTQSCVTTWFFFWSTTTCAPEPTGPQQVVPNGWLSGKTLKQLSTGLSGYTCALSTSNNVGCWGSNYAGQIGDGTVTNRLVPTALRLQ